MKRLTPIQNYHTRQSEVEYPLAFGNSRTEPVIAAHHIVAGSTLQPPVGLRYHDTLHCGFHKASVSRNYPRWLGRGFLTSQMPLFVPSQQYCTTQPFNGRLSGTTRVSRYQKGKPIWILLKQETVSGNGISWAVCKSAPRSGQTTMPALHHLVITDRMPFLPPNQQRQSTEGSGCNLFLS